MRFAGWAFQKRGRDPRLPDTCLAGEQHHLAFTPLCPRPAPKKQFEFFFASDQRGQTRRVQCLELSGRRPFPETVGLRGRRSNILGCAGGRCRLNWGIIGLGLSSKNSRLQSMITSRLVIALVLSLNCGGWLVPQKTARSPSKCARHLHRQSVGRDGGAGGRSIWEECHGMV
jgi:hypothetical protein